MFSKHVGDPSAADRGDTIALQRALDKYPYCQLLHLFYTHSLSVSEPENSEIQLSRTALFVPDRTVLYNFLQEPEKFSGTGITALNEASYNKEAVPEFKEEIPLSSAGEIITENPVSSQEPLVAEDDISMPDEDINIVEISAEPETEKEEIPANIPDSASKTRHDHIDGSDLLENIFNNIIGFRPEETIPEPVKKKPAQAADKAGDQVNTPVTENQGQAKQGPEGEIKASPVQESVPVEEAAAVDNLRNEQEFTPVAEPALDQSKQAEPEFAPSAEPAAGQSMPVETEKEITGEDQKVSKYDDDKMPYSFLWWLNKTRKEHADTYQPYVDFKLDTSQKIRKPSADQLSSQIIENIFHLQSPLEQLENPPRTIPFQIKRKEDFILEKFIKEEPQIKAPHLQKLDTENKARKSAEDPNDLVSETLAQIYTDQMLFQKAIDTYKKLSLKFPEKSTYFADQILELEKKVN